MNKILKTLINTDAILEGHFLLTSGKHSTKYIEKFRLLENPKSLNFICKTIAEKYRSEKIDIVLGAAIGGILIAGGVGRHLNVKNIFTERVKGSMELRRDFEIKKNDRILIVEDIVTTGGSIKELIDVAEDCNADIIGIASILDRNLELVDFKYKYSPLVQYSVESWLEQDCPSCKKNLSITKRGRSGKK